MKTKSLFYLCATLFVLLSLSACGNATPAPTAVAAAPTATNVPPTETPMPPTATPTALPTLTRTATPQPTNTQIASLVWELVDKGNVVTILKALGDIGLHVTNYYSQTVSFAISGATYALTPNCYRPVRIKPDSLQTWTATLAGVAPATGQITLKAGEVLLLYFGPRPNTESNLHSC